MRLRGEAYSERLEAYSTSTLELMAELDMYGKEMTLKKTDITTDSELSEEQVVEKLLELKRSYLEQTVKR